MRTARMIPIVIPCAASAVAVVYFCIVFYVLKTTFERFDPKSSITRRSDTSILADLALIALHGAGATIALVAVPMLFIALFYQTVLSYDSIRDPQGITMLATACISLIAFAAALPRKKRDDQWS